MNDLIVGFTGTQSGMSDNQKLKLHQLLMILNPTWFHHGDCIGADAEAHIIAKELGILTFVHPPNNNSKRAWMAANYTASPKSYMERNHDIVNDSNFVIAAPSSNIELRRSGTWATIRYARKQGKAVTILVR